MLWLQEWMISGSNSPRDLNPMALELFFDNQKNQSVMSHDHAVDFKKIGWVLAKMLKIDKIVLTS